MGESGETPVPRLKQKVIQTPLEATALVLAPLALKEPPYFEFSSKGVGMSVSKDDKDASKPVARHFNLPNHSKTHMAVCGLSLHQGSTESHKTLEQRFIFQIGTLNPHGINERFSFN